MPTRRRRRSGSSNSRVPAGIPTWPAWLVAIRLVAITDRRLMGPDVAAAIAAVVARHAPGSVLVQIREPGLDGAALLALVRAALAMGACVAVNDRLDVALAAGAHAVHLPERGLPVALARSLAPGLVIGRSVHTVEAALAAARTGVDLVQLGPIWLTSAPGKAPVLGPDALRAVRRQLDAEALPTRLVAVGGIDGPARRAAALAAGAHATAAIRASWTV